MGRQILVVDDDVGIRTALKLRLERDAFTVYTAADGEEALEQVSRVKPDLVILDLALPYRDGLDVLARLKESAATAAIPVIILTARYQSREEHPVFLSTAAEVIAKPFSPRYVVQRVQSLLSLDAGGDAPPASPRNAEGDQRLYG